MFPTLPELAAQPTLQIAPNGKEFYEYQKKRYPPLILKFLPEGRFPSSGSLRFICPMEGCKYTQNRLQHIANHLFATRIHPNVPKECRLPDINVFTRETADVVRKRYVLRRRRFIFI